MSYFRGLIIVFILGIIFGSIFSLIFLRIFPNIVPFTRDTMPLTTMFQIFLKNSFLATLICYGGVIFSLIELRLSKFGYFYRIIDRSLDPFYYIIGKIFKEFKKLGRLYRSLYLCPPSFPFVCTFLIGFIISLYFSIFFILTELGPKLLLRSLPHLTLEVSVFISSANIALEISRPLKKYIFKKQIKEFKRKSVAYLNDKKIWKKLFILYIILLFSSFIEKFFIGF